MKRVGKKRHLILLPVFAVLLLGTIWGLETYIPLLKQKIFINAKILAKKHSPFEVDLKEIEFDFFPPGITFKDVLLKPKAPPLLSLGSIEIPKLSATIGLMALTRGEFALGEVVIEDFKHDLKVDSLLSDIDRLPKSKDPQHLDWNILKKIPIGKITLKNTDLQATFNKMNYAIRKADIQIENLNRALFLELDLPDLQSSYTGKNSHSLSANLFFSKKRFQINAFQFKSKKSYLVTSGTVLGDFRKRLQVNKVNIKTRSFLKFAELSQLLKNNPRLAQLLPFKVNAEGTLHADIHLTQHLTQKLPNAKFSFRGRSLRFNKYTIGNFESKGLYTPKKVKINSLYLTNAAGEARLSKTEVGLGEKYTLKTQLDIPKAEVAEFLQTIGLKKVPLIIKASGKIPCSGEIYPDTEIRCTAKIESPYVHIYSGSSGKTIVEADSLSAEGDFTVTSKNISYKSTIAFHEARGTSEGVIDYEKGFDIKYAGNIPDVQKIRNIADLKVEGAVNLKGKTSGNSDKATFSMNARAEKFWFENYFLDNVITTLSYKAGQLSFLNSKAKNGVSKFQGDINLDIKKSVITVDAEAPFLEISDIQTVMQRIVKLPIEARGTGFAKIKLWGPLALNQLNLDFSSSFFRGNIDKESFDELQANLTARNGNLQTQKIILKKSESQVQVSGQLNNQGTLNASVTGSDLRLEQTEYITDLGLNVKGSLDFTMKLNGDFFRPDTTLSGKISRFKIGDKAAANSRFKLRLRKESIEGEGNFIGQTVQAKFNIPFVQSKPFLLHLKSRNWNFINLFSFFSENALRRGFTTNLDGELFLQSNSGGFWNSNGYLNFDDLVISRGDTYLKSVGPMRIVYKDGVFQTDNFVLNGVSSSLKLESLNAKKDNLRFNLNGNLDLSMASLFTPFFDELTGQASLGIKFSGPINNLNTVGSTYLQNTYVKIKNFPHALEEISADILFGAKNILINSLKAKLGKGPVSAEGEIQLRSWNDIPIRVNGQFRNVSLNIPEGFKTKGSGEFYIKGRRAPYTLGVNHIIESGSVEKDLSQASNDKKGAVQRGSFLPKFLTKNDFQPISLDLNISIPKPLPVHFLVARMDVKTPVVGELRAHGVPSNILLDGTIKSVPEGFILFNSNRFTIQNGVITYDNAPPQSPDLNVSAESRVRPSSTTNNNNSDEEYDISLLVLGKASDPKVSLKSQPQLNEQEILSLLAFGFITDDSTLAALDDDATGQGGYKIDSKFIADELGISREIKDKLGLEFDLSSQNTNDGQVHRVTLRKQITPKFGIEANRTIQKNPVTEMRGEYRLNNRVSITGEWINQDSTAVENPDNDERVGVGIEYKVKFK